MRVRHHKSLRALRESLAFAFRLAVHFGGGLTSDIAESSFSIHTGRAKDITKTLARTYR